jgi:hypothetical protein
VTKPMMRRRIPRMIIVSSWQVAAAVRDGGRGFRMVIFLACSGGLPSAG